MLTGVWKVPLPPPSICLSSSLAVDDVASGKKSDKADVAAAASLFSLASLPPSALPAPPRTLTVP